MYHQMCEAQAALSQVYSLREQLEPAQEKMRTAQRCMAAVAAMDLCRDYVEQLASMQDEMKPDTEM